MNNQEFDDFIVFIQNTLEIANNISLRRKAYSEFNRIVDYLEERDWDEKFLKEHQSQNDEAIFQNLAEAYYKLGFIELVFFEYSRIIYEIWYKKTISFQNKSNKRIHKGTQVHQIAQIYTIQNKHSKAWEYYFAGFVEDIIDDRNYKESQAFRVLMSMSVPKNNFEIFTTEIKKLKGKDTYNPIEIVQHAEKDTIIPTFEENQSVDLIKLDQAKKLWEQVISK